MSSPKAGLRKGQLLMDPECHLRVVCVPFPSLGLGLDPQRHFQAVGLPSAVTFFWRVSQRGRRGQLSRWLTAWML